MELKKAIEYLQELKQTLKTAFWSKEYVDFRVVAIDTVLAELDKKEERIKNYQNTIEVIEDLGQMKIEKQIELAKQKWGDK